MMNCCRVATLTSLTFAVLSTLFLTTAQTATVRSFPRFDYGKVLSENGQFRSVVLNICSDAALLSD